LKDRFLGQKNIDPDFSATTVAGIWVKQATRRKLKKNEQRGPTCGPWLNGQADLASQV